MAEEQEVKSEEQTRRERDAIAAAKGLLQGLLSVFVAFVFLYALYICGRWVLTDGNAYLNSIGCSLKEKVVFGLLALNAAVLLIVSWRRNALLKAQNQCLVEIFRAQKAMLEASFPVYNDIQSFMKSQAELARVHKEYILQKHSVKTDEQPVPVEGENLDSQQQPKEGE